VLVCGVGAVAGESVVRRKGLFRGEAISFIKVNIFSGVRE
jgi:hypothetical protein